MVTISRVVEKRMSEKPFLQEALKKGIINYYALADSMLEDVEKEIGKKIKAPAIMMALRRLSERLEKKSFEEIKFTLECNIVTRDGLLEITFDKNKKNLEKLRKIFDKVDYSKGDFLTVTQGIYEISLITNEHKIRSLKKMFNEDIIKITKGLGAVTLTLPLKIVESPGFFYLVTRAIAWENININEIVSTTRELTLIIKYDDIPKVYNILRKLLNEKR